MGGVRRRIPLRKVSSQPPAPLPPFWATHHQPRSFRVIKRGGGIPQEEGRCGPRSVNTPPSWCRRRSWRRTKYAENIPTAAHTFPTAHILCTVRILSPQRHWVWLLPSQSDQGIPKNRAYLHSPLIRQYYILNRAYLHSSLIRQY